MEINAELAAKIDVLIEKEYYPDRAEFIEKAIEAQLNLHVETFQELERQHSFVMGFVNYSRKELEKIAGSGKKIDLKVIGRLSFSNDVTPELIERTISKINMAGILKAPKTLLPLLNGRRYSILGNKYDSRKVLEFQDQKE
jgi:Arc/MetJ-type ribon-helix-helix transcriptional regulator